LCGGLLMSTRVLGRAFETRREQAPGPAGQTA